MASDSFDLASVFSDCGVPPITSVAIVSSGWDIEKFALGFKSDQDFGGHEILTELGLKVDLSRLHRASLKQAWNRCVQQCKSEVAGIQDSSSQPKQSPNSGLTIDPSEGSWSEAFAPKLGGQVVSVMKNKFVQ